MTKVILMSLLKKRSIKMRSEEDEEKLAHFRAVLRTVDKDILQGFIISLIEYNRLDPKKSLKAKVDSVMNLIYKELN